MSALDSIEGIAAFSTARSMAETRLAAATKVMELARDQNEVVANFVAESLQNIEELIADFASDVGSNVNTYA